MTADFTCAWQSNLRAGSLLRFAVTDGGLKLAEGRLEMADLVFIEKSNSRRGFADCYSKVCSADLINHEPMQMLELWVVRRLQFYIRVIFHEFLLH